MSVHVNIRFLQESNWSSTVSLCDVDRRHGRARAYCQAVNSVMALLSRAQAGARYLMS